jgi:PAS domain S-box-containing protein
VDERGRNSPSNDPPGKVSPAPFLGGAEEQHRLLMECVTDYAIFYLDPQGRVASWNTGAERAFGYAEAEIVGQHFSCFFTAEDVQRGQPGKELRTAAEMGRASDDRWMVRKGGAHLSCNGVTTALRDEEGKLRGFAKVLRDRAAGNGDHSPTIATVEPPVEVLQGFRAGRLVAEATLDLGWWIVEYRPPGYDYPLISQYDSRADVEAALRALGVTVARPAGG